MPDTPNIRPNRRPLLTHHHRNHHHYNYYYTSTRRYRTTSSRSTSLSLTLIPVVPTKVRTTKSTFTKTVSFLYLFMWYIYCNDMIRSKLQLSSNYCLNNQRTIIATVAMLPTVTAFSSARQCWTTHTSRKLPVVSTSSLHIIQYRSDKYTRNYRRLRTLFMIIQNQSYTTTTTTASTRSTTQVSSTTASAVGATIPTDMKPIALQHIEFKSTNTQVHPDEQEQQEPSPVVIFLHGLLGNKRNFASIGRSLAATTTTSSKSTRPRIIYSLDLRNHGDTYSMHRNQNHDTDTASSMDMSYRTMAYDVIHFCNAHNITQIDTLIGHSIGGKVAQAVALLEPSRVQGLIVLDIAPVQYTSKEPHWLAVEEIIRTLLNVNMSSNRNDVEQQLRSSIPDPNLRAFCLTNVDWSTGQWKIPLNHIYHQLEKLASFDLAEGTSSTTEEPQKLLYTGDAFFINGGQSKFVRSSHLSSIQQYFPNHMLTTIKGAGHWVHAEAPEDTTALIQQFLNR